MKAMEEEGSRKTPSSAACDVHAPPLSARSDGFGVFCHCSRQFRTSPILFVEFFLDWQLSACYVEGCMCNFRSRAFMGCHVRFWGCVASFGVWVSFVGYF